MRPLTANKHSAHHIDPREHLKLTSVSPPDLQRLHTETYCHWIRHPWVDADNNTRRLANKTTSIWPKSYLLHFTNKIPFADPSWLWAYRRCQTTMNGHLVLLSVSFLVCCVYSAPIFYVGDTDDVSATHLKSTLTSIETFFDCSDFSWVKRRLTDAKPLGWQCLWKASGQTRWLR